jgi:hypothetical protein
VKITKQELSNIIKEEVDKMQAQGELEEGFLDKLLGRDSPKFGDFVNDDEVKRKLDMVQKNLGDLRGLAARQNNKELGVQVSKISNDVGSLYSKATPKGPELKTITNKPEDQTLKNLKADLTDPKRRSKITTQTLIKTLSSLSPGTKVPTGPDGLPDRQTLMNLVQKQLSNVPDVRDFSGNTKMPNSLNRGAAPPIAPIRGV